MVDSDSPKVRKATTTKVTRMKKTGKPQFAGKVLRSSMFFLLSKLRVLPTTQLYAHARLHTKKKVLATEDR